MNYSKRAMELAVGVFLVLAAGAMVLLAFQVSGLSKLSRQDTYTVYGMFHNASGLTARAKVTSAGVEIGRVTSIQLDPISMKAKVTMAINQDVDFLSIDSIASIRTAGMLGEKYISISVGAEDEVLGAGDEIEDTTSALVLEELIGKFVSAMGKD